MNKKINFKKLFDLLSQDLRGFEAPVVDFLYSKKFNNLQILISIILSSRTNDKTTLKASLRLFKKVKNCKDIKKLTLIEIQKLIYPVGFYRIKSKNLKKLCSVLNKNFYDTIPGTIDELIKLPGVGRKTANLYISTVLKKPAICVDVHVHRILNRIGYLKTRSLYETEMFLRKNLDIKYWRKINFVLVLFGQNICKSINPKCDFCSIKKYCLFYEKINKKNRTSQKLRNKKQN
ncbi:MAG: endonuclease III [Patescibacteria group bacterium]|nr:endonuclease III [Patescibacteria group bacterium]